jgi:hypothetical protein
MKTKTNNGTSLAERVRALKIGMEIEVETAGERVRATNMVRTMREIGQCAFVLRTWKTEAGKFVLRATKP